MNTLKCTKCGCKVIGKKTRYGVRSSCCDLWSWGGKPLVSFEIHELRREFHKEFDKLWKNEGYDRNELYHEMSEKLKLHPSKVHGASCEDAEILGRMIKFAKEK